MIRKYLTVSLAAYPHFSTHRQPIEAVIQSRPVRNEVRHLPNIGTPPQHRVGIIGTSSRIESAVKKACAEFVVDIEIFESVQVAAARAIIEHLTLLVVKTDHIEDCAKQLTDHFRFFLAPPSVVLVVDEGPTISQELMLPFFVTQLTKLNDGELLLQGVQELLRAAGDDD